MGSSILKIASSILKIASSILKIHVTQRYKWLNDNHYDCLLIGILVIFISEMRRLIGAFYKEETLPSGQKKCVKMFLPLTSSAYPRTERKKIAIYQKLVATWKKWRKIFCFRIRSFQVENIWDCLSFFHLLDQIFFPTFLEWAPNCQRFSFVAWGCFLC